MSFSYTGDHILQLFIQGQLFQAFIEVRSIWPLKFCQQVGPKLSNKSCINRWIVKRGDSRVKQPEQSSLIRGGYIAAQKTANIPRELHKQKRVVLIRDRFRSRRCAVQQDEQCNLLSALLQLPSYLIGDDATHTPSSQMIRPFGLNRAYLLHVIRSQRPYVSIELFIVIQTGCLQRVKRLLPSQMARQCDITENRAAPRMHEEQRRIRASSLQTYNGRSELCGGPVLAQGSRQMLDGRLLEKQGQRELLTELLFNPGHQLDRQERVTAQVKEISGDTNRAYLQYFFP